MCGIIVVVNGPTIICLPTVCYFSREATSEIYGLRVYLLSYCFQIYLLSYLFSDISFQKPKNTLLHFFIIYFISRFIEIYLSNLHKFYPVNLTIFGTVTRRGIDNPSYASGCKYLFFVCRYHLHSVAWFSYWIDTLVP